jgi:hypothetical protein
MYKVEMTDTFGDDANYCWVNRLWVKAKSPASALRKANKHWSIAPRSWRLDWDYGDERRYNMNKAAICCFVTWCEDDEPSLYNEQADVI